MSDMANIRNQRRFRKPVSNIFGIFDERVPRQMRVPVQAVDRDPQYRPKTEVPAQNMDRDPHQTFARVRPVPGTKPLQRFRPVPEPGTFANQLNNRALFLHGEGEKE